MARVERDENREHRIEFEIMVDTYGEEEQALGWYYYLEDRLIFPFGARCIFERRTSLLRVGEVVEAIGLAPEDDCRRDMFVVVRWQRRTFGAALSQLEGISLQDEARQVMVCFGRIMVSHAAIARSAQEGRDMVFLEENGRFQARVVGRTAGNVLLRLTQHAAFQDPQTAVKIASAIVAAKVQNSRLVLLREARQITDAYLISAGLGVRPELSGW